MAWYAAHLLFLTRYRDGEQDDYPMQEDIVLIQASSREAAHGLATYLGYESAVDDPTETRGERPVGRTFEGVRRLVACIPSPWLLSSNPGAADSLELPTGSQVSASLVVAADREDYEAFLSGDRDAWLTFIGGKE